MTIEDAVLDRLRRLPADKQQKVLEYLDALQSEPSPAAAPARRSMIGLWSDLNIHITDEEIAEARREMWGNFPRDDIA